MKTSIRATDIVHEVSSGDERLTILDGLSLTLEQGDSVAVIGASGSGKSTLLSLLAGLDVATRGEIELDGARLDRLDEDGRASLRAGRVGFVFQDFRLMDGLTALENVMLPLELAGIPDPKTTAKEALEQAGLGHRLNHAPSKLSGGEQQRVAIARAFAPSPKILFADEPTGNLDQDTGHRITELLFSLNAGYDTTLLLVTHDDELAGRCDRVLRLDEGRLHELPA